MFMRMFPGVIAPLGRNPLPYVSSGGGEDPRLLFRATVTTGTWDAKAYYESAGLTFGPDGKAYIQGAFDLSASVPGAVAGSITTTYRHASFDGADLQSLQFSLVMGASIGGSPFPDQLAVSTAWSIAGEATYHPTDAKIVGTEYDHALTDDNLTGWYQTVASEADNPWNIPSFTFEVWGDVDSVTPIDASQYNRMPNDGFMEGAYQTIDRYGVYRGLTTTAATRAGGIKAIATMIENNICEPAKLLARAGYGFAFINSANELRFEGRTTRNALVDTSVQSVICTKDSTKAQFLYVKTDGSLHIYDPFVLTTNGAADFPPALGSAGAGVAAVAQRGGSLFAALLTTGDVMFWGSSSTGYTTVNIPGARQIMGAAGAGFLVRDSNGKVSQLSTDGTATAITARDTKVYEVGTDNRFTEWGRKDGGKVAPVAPTLITPNEGFVMAMGVPVNAAGQVTEIDTDNPVGTEYPVLGSMQVEIALQGYVPVGYAGLHAFDKGTFTTLASQQQILGYGYDNFLTYIEPNGIMAGLVPDSEFSTAQKLGMNFNPFAVDAFMRIGNWIVSAYGDIRYAGPPTTDTFDRRAKPSVTGVKGVVIANRVSQTVWYVDSTGTMRDLDSGLTPNSWLQSQRFTVVRTDAREGISYALTSAGELWAYASGVDGSQPTSFLATDASAVDVFLYFGAPDSSGVIQKVPLFKYADGSYVESGSYGITTGFTLTDVKQWIKSAGDEALFYVSATDKKTVSGRKYYSNTASGFGDLPLDPTMVVTWATDKEVASMVITPNYEYGSPVKWHGWLYHYVASDGSLRKGKVEFSSATTYARDTETELLPAGSCRTNFDAS